MPARLPKINALIQRELGQLISRDLDLPVDCLITVTSVDTSRDLKQAKISVSVLPHGRGPQILKTLDRQAEHWRYCLKKRLQMKFIPRLTFQWDHTENDAAEIESLLNQLKTEN